MCGLASRYSICNGSGNLVSAFISFLESPFSWAASDGSRRVRSNDPGKVPRDGSPRSLRGILFRVMKLTPSVSTLIDGFNDTHCPSRNKVQSSSTFPLSELSIIKYLGLELSFSLGHCLR